MSAVFDDIEAKVSKLIQLKTGGSSLVTLFIFSRNSISAGKVVG
jgi:hypothetical protein